MVVNEINWGSVPQWLSVPGSLSVVIAFLVFRRDRENRERIQVDRVGAGATTDYEPRMPGETPRIDRGVVKAYVRNGSELPVRIAQIAFRIETLWAVADDQSGPELPVWRVEQGTEPVRSFANDLVVPPGEVKEWSFETNVAHTAPAGAVQLAVAGGIAAHVDWLLIVDNAGRRWEVHPERAGRAITASRRWRAKEYMPREW